jgi:hypothetical protein
VGNAVASGTFSTPDCDFIEAVLLALLDVAIDTLLILVSGGCSDFVVFLPVAIAA